jgi:hypothetical protein
MCIGEAVHFTGDEAGEMHHHVVSWSHKVNHSPRRYEKGLDLGVEGQVNPLCKEEQFKLFGDTGKDCVLQPSFLEHTGSVDGGPGKQEVGECNDDTRDSHVWWEIGMGKVDEDGLVVPDWGMGGGCCSCIARLELYILTFSFMLTNAGYSRASIRWRLWVT